MIRVVAAVGVAASGVAFVTVYPWVLDGAIARFGTRLTAAFLVGIVALTVPVRSRRLPGSPLLTLGLAGLLLGAATTGDRTFLRLIPGWVYLGLAWLCVSSLRDGGSLIEEGARAMVPEAPDFISGYCRVVTALWGAFFAACALVIAALALGSSAAAWQGFSGRTIWWVMAGLTVTEFFVRKTWFRYYFRGGPFDRFWARLFPAEATARGRRSLAAIRAHRERLRDDGDVVAVRNEGSPTDARS